MFLLDLYILTLTRVLSLTILLRHFHSRPLLQSVINYLAIYWAGGKVVAVDPLTSAEDLKFILDDAQPDLVLTDEEIA
ncbi:hypothetical protein DJ524_07870, partial [Sulfolobus sp. D5]